MGLISKENEGSVKRTRVVEGVIKNSGRERRENTHKAADRPIRFPKILLYRPLKFSVRPPCQMAERVWGPHYPS